MAASSASRLPVETRVLHSFPYTLPQSIQNDHKVFLILTVIAVCFVCSSQSVRHTVQQVHAHRVLGIWGGFLRGYSVLRASREAEEFCLSLHARCA